MSHERDAAELAALIEADLKVSGAQTSDELRAALDASVHSLMRLAKVVAAPPSEADKQSRFIRVRLTLPRLPTSDRSKP